MILQAHRLKVGLCITFIFMLALSTYFVKLYAEPIVMSEYYFDTDPGYGMGIQIGIHSMVEGNYRYSANIDLGSLEPGYHRIYVRSKSEDGTWTNTNMRTFYIDEARSISQIVRSEYFIDNDPGYGMGIPIGLQSLLDGDYRYSASIELCSLEPGYHRIFVRSETEDGTWTNTNTRTFYIDEARSVTEIVRSEYFIDTDPGFGNGTLISSGQSPSSDMSVNFSLETASLTPGYHSIFIRSLDAHGSWTQSIVNRFFKAPEEAMPATISYAEYFIDIDPGYGLGTEIDMENSQTNAFNASLINLDSGYHSIFIRAKDSSGVWTQTCSRRFYNIPNYVVPAEIEVVEYYIDADPGFGLGESVSFDDVQTSEMSFNVNIDTSTITEGFHSMAMRSRDATGVWTQTCFRRFYHIPQASETNYITNAEYFVDSDPGPGEGIDVQIANNDRLGLSIHPQMGNLSLGFHTVGIRVRDALGSWSQSSYRRFCKSTNYDQPPLIVGVEYFFDEDPGYGNGIAIPIESDTLLIASFIASALNLVPGQHKIFVRAKTHSWSQVYFQQFYGGSPFAIEIPQQVTGVNVIIRNYDALISWQPVTHAESGNPIIPDAYIVLYNETPETEADNYYYLGYTIQTQMHHYGVVRFRDMMFYKVIAMKYYRDGLATVLRSQESLSPTLTWAEVKKLIEASNGENTSLSKKRSD